MSNTALPVLTDNIVQWHRDRNLIDGSTDEAQLGKLLEEFTEVVAAVYAGRSPIQIKDIITNKLDQLHLNQRIKTVEPEDALKALADGIGDMDVVMINLATRNGLTKQDCLAQAYDDIKFRKGKMIGGIFIKEEDL